MEIQPTEAQINAAHLLETSIREENEELADVAITTAYKAGPHPLYGPLLMILAEASWHYRHEDVVLEIQRLRWPDAVTVLERIASCSPPPYLAWNELLPLARKCTWALADIGTTEARQALKRLATSKNELVAGYAKKRLANWQKELHRKGLNHASTRHLH
jgi:hypothetical protein